MKKKNHQSKGVRLWNEAKEIIPGGCQLLSKRAEMYLPGGWPAYYKKAKGVHVWDLDHRKYVDMSIMGMGTCILGYANKEVDAAVKRCIDDGSMATLNCYEEVELAQELIKLHPWAQMVRYSRSGGEACTIAVRIARAFTKKSKIAFCGYHGWHDWYISSNLGNDKHLDGQLMPGLPPSGVPRELENTSFPFTYGKVDELEKIVGKHKDVGVIIMEVARYKEIDLAFLKSVQEIARRIGAVLIFDEITSGFRLCPGGMHRLYKLEPDIAILGKALGNGFPISAIIGRREVMQAAQDSFISSTYWSERVGFVAALETIKQYKKLKVEKKITATGEYLKKGLKKIFTKFELPINVIGLSSAPLTVITDPKAAILQTLYTQEMLKEGYLAANLIYVSIAHTKAVADKFLKTADRVWKKIAIAYKANTLEKMLEGPVCHSGFKRLT